MGQKLLNPTSYDLWFQDRYAVITAWRSFVISGRKKINHFTRSKINDNVKINHNNNTNKL